MDPPPLSILESLNSSRQNILHGALPPFSTPSLPHLQHPPHVLSHFATTNVTIGPHSFSNTKFYLVEWTTPHQPPQPQSAPAPVSSSAPPRPVSPPKPKSDAAITPSLIQRLNAASLTDPALAALLRRAANGQATPDELGGLSKKIEELRKEEELENNPPPAEPTPPPLPPVPLPEEPVANLPPLIPHPALLIEFSESSHTRFLIPDHYLCVTLTPRAAPSAPITTFALLLSFFVFPPDRSIKGKEHEYVNAEGMLPPPPPVPVDMIVEGVTEEQRDQFVKASRLGRPRDTGLENWWKNTIASVPPRVHVIHQKPQLPQLPEPPSAALSRTASDHAVTVPMKRGASGTPASGSGANKRGKPAPVPPPRRAAPRASNTRSRSSMSAAPNYRDSPEPSSQPESPGLRIGSPAPPPQPPLRKKPGPKPGSTRGGRGGGGGRKGKGRRKKADTSSDEDDWSGIKVIE